MNRTLKFIQKAYNSKVPDKQVSQKIIASTEDVYQSAGNWIKRGKSKKALEEIFSYIRSANRYFDQQKPWEQVKINKEAGEMTLANCTFMIVNLAHLLEPFLPFSARKIRAMLGITNIEWHIQYTLPKEIIYVAPLFERLDLGLIEEELNQLIMGQKHS